MKKLTVLTIIIASVFMLAPVFGQVYPDGMVSYWKFDEDSGTIATDSVGTNDGTLVNGPVWTSGQVDGALSFDGVDDYVEVPRVVQDDFSIEFWVKTTQVGNTSVYGAFTSTGLVDGEVGGKGRDYIVGLHANNIAFGAGYPEISIYSSSVVNDGIWHYVVATRKSGALKLYIDNNLEATGSTGADSLTDPQSLSIGRLNQHQWYFNGLMDEVAIYDRALTAEEIQQHYQNGLNGLGYEEYITVDIDIKPGSCPNPLNVRSKGVLPVAILGSEDFDVGMIDVASIRLAGVDPNRSSYEDVAAPVTDGNECDCTTAGPDDYLDLTLKFKTQDIVQSLGEVVNGEVLILTLTGVLSDGTPIEGEDCIRVKKPRAKRVRKAKKPKK